MPNPTPRDMHVDTLLTNMSVGYVQSQDKFFANKLFPTVPVMKQTDLYPVWPKGAFFRDQVKARPLGGAVPIVGFDVGTASYICTEYGLGTMIDDRTRANADKPFNPDKASMRLLVGQHLIKRDRIAATTYLKTGVWGTDLAGVASAPSAGQFLRFDQSGSDPIGVISKYKDRVAEQTGYEPNVLTLGRATKRILKEHPQIVGKIQYTQKGIITDALLAELFEVERILTPSAIYNTAKEGGTDNLTFIVDSKCMLLSYAASEPAMEEPSGGYTFAWTGLLPGATADWGGVIERGREGRNHSDYIEARAAYDIKLVCPDVGVFFSDVVGD
ncbi:hypothetical protein ABMY26_00240 (plasmid) [Azospirillum sp. HJ39]|uniref:hypothetical protein n=1 Tax=Azospirillum sp. HJ39 TaxID=3159496 RepID=UPI0035571ECD